MGMGSRADWLCPRAFRARVVAIVVACTTLPPLLSVAWVCGRAGVPPEQVLAASLVILLVALAGTLLALGLIDRLSAPLRDAAAALEAYSQHQQLPQLPDHGRDELGQLLRGINHCLHRVDSGVRELERHALEDALTGVRNRRGCELAMAESVAAAQRGGLPFVLCVVDLDNLKTINDECGHAAGDAALQAVVDSAGAWLGAGDWIGRWGGDEFLVGIQDDSAAAQARLRGWLDAMGLGVAGRARVYASVGCAVLQPGQDAAQLYRHADAAMYQAKFSGGGRVVCHCGSAVAAAAADAPARMQLVGG